MWFRYCPLLGFALLASLSLVPSPNRLVGQTAPRSALSGEDPPLLSGIEVQARGVVHEAYAEPSVSPAQAGPLISREPPRPIEEAPPEEKPQGDNIAWIPGYWAWEEEAEDYLWISGFWRALPPGRIWIPGTWHKVAGGYRRVAGYWGVAEQEQTEYLPPPPESLDLGPSVPAPGENYSYIPGIWMFQENRYLWRPGYWLPYRPGWVWVPSCYKWTPAGCVFVPGYWDLPLLERGLLFAPVRFTSPVFLRPGFVYQPAFCIQPDFLCGALFLRRGFPCYYFGDYFGPRYRTGFTPWNQFRFARGVGIDMNFGYYRHAYRGVRGWESGLNNLYAGRFAGTIAAPPRTWSQQNRVVNNLLVQKTSNQLVHKNVSITHLQNAQVLTPVRRVNQIQVTGLSALAGPTAKAPSPVRKELAVQRLSRDRLQEERQAVLRYQTLARARQTTETRLAPRAPTKPSDTPVRAKIEVPRGTPPARIARSITPPAPPPTERPSMGRQPEAKPGPTVPSRRPETPPTKETRPPSRPESSPKPPVKPPISESKRPSEANRPTNKKAPSSPSTSPPNGSLSRPVPAKPMPPTSTPQAKPATPTKPTTPTRSSPPSRPTSEKPKKESK